MYNIKALKNQEIIEQDQEGNYECCYSWVIRKIHV